MNNMYKKIENLCIQRGISFTGLSKATGIPRSVFSELKSGRTKQLSSKHLPVVAEYLNVSIDFLLDQDTEKAPAPDGERQVSDEDIKFALFGGSGKEITDAMAASQAYSANVTAFNTLKSVISRGLDLGSR